MSNNTTNNSESNSEDKKKHFLIKLSPSLHQESHAMTVPVSLITLPILIDELWETFKHRSGILKINWDAHKGNYINSYWDGGNKKEIFKKVMLMLAEAKVCCAQRAFPHKLDLPQRDLYFQRELLKLNLLAKKLPYPMALYLDCLGNTAEGNLSITPVLAKVEGLPDIADAISGGPKQLLPLLHLSHKGVGDDHDVYKLAKVLKAHPNIELLRDVYSKEFRLGESHLKFWQPSNGVIEISDDEIRVFREIVDRFDGKNFNTETDLFKGQGTMAQTVQTPEWRFDGTFRYFCMADISEYDQKLGATFGFGFTAGQKIQKSRYDGSSELAFWRGEVLPKEMLKSMLDENSV